MRPLSLSALLLLLLSTLSVSAADPSGHWDGVIHAEVDVTIAIDLVRNDRGEITGTFDNPMQSVRAFPLANVAADGASVTFAIKASEGGGVFRAKLGADGKSMKGTFTTRGPDSQPLELPFELTRTGEAKIQAAAKSAAIGKELEGRWAGTLDVQGTARQVGLRLGNQPDGTSTGFVISGDGVEIAITSIVQKGTSVSLDVKNIGGSYAGTLNAAGTEIAGTWTQGSFVAPLTFRLQKASSSGPESTVDRWAAAAGGRERIAAIRSIYREATIEAFGQRGWIKVWHTADGRYRKEEQIASLSSIETFDGTSGAMRQGEAPPRPMTAAEVELARSQAFANFNSVFLAFFPAERGGSIRAADDGAIVLVPKGGLERRVMLDPETSLPKTMTHQRGERTITVDFRSYETVDGVRLEKEIHRSTGDPRFDAVIRFTKTVFNPPLEAALFSIAPASDVSAP